DAQRLRERVDVLLLGRVVVVDAVEGGTGRRGDREEALLHADALHGGLQVRDVAVDAVVVGVLDGAHADIGAAPASNAAHLAGEELGEPLGGVAPGEVVVLVAIGVVLEAGDALVDVGGPRRLRELAVVDDVDAGLVLVAY